MARTLEGTVAVVTGASSGIGGATHPQHTAVDQILIGLTEQEG